MLAKKPSTLPFIQALHVRFHPVLATYSKLAADGKTPSASPGANHLTVIYTSKRK
ncbi:hypothetical protein BofuT4_uP092410.1 [Botrytis cinerea T4]|uniref:Uncharacterized protein n=1 Tax=Botryotinia fuckeliana (strain T4) TaxID=999810 RepID=G2YDX1_BOTF4|nr:hypothetical protein BofuT4_uP092410.1 [Botrytis cinerea T4]